MSSYFDGFPSITQTINNRTTTLVDITYAPAILPDEFSKQDIKINGEDEIGGLSLTIYNDAQGFWAFLYANEQLNPWEFIPERPSDYQERNHEYASATLKYGLSKLNPNVYIECQPGDIIVSANTYVSGMTASEALFNFDNWDVWFVEKAFSDTKKAKITENLTPGMTFGTDIYSPDATVYGANLQVLRKGMTGYYLVQAPAAATAKVATNLKTYAYLDSPAFAVSKELEDLTSPSEVIDSGDSIFTVLVDDSPTLAAQQAVSADYNIVTTKTVQNRIYLQQNQIKYIQQGSFSKILNKLI